MISSLFTTLAVFVLLLNTTVAQNAVKSIQKTFAATGEDLGVSTITGTKYYVDCNAGSDSNDGKSESRAWKSIDKANTALLAPGDGLLFKRGCTWTGKALTAKWSGTAAAPIVISAYGPISDPIPHIKNAYSNNVTVTGKYQIVEFIRSTHDRENYPDVYQRLAEDTEYDDYLCKRPFGNKPGFYVTDSAQYNTIQYAEATGNSVGVSFGDKSYRNKVLHSRLYDNMGIHSAQPYTNPVGTMGVLLHGIENEIAYNLFQSTFTQPSGWCQTQENSVEIFKAKRSKIHHNRAFGDRVFSEMGSWAQDGESAISEDNVYAYNLHVTNYKKPRFLVIRADGLFGPVRRTKAYNNTIYYTAPSDTVAVSCGGCDRIGTTIKNNIFRAGTTISGSNVSSYASNNISNPQFVNATMNPSTANFALKTGSPGINAGSSDLPAPNNVEIAPVLAMDLNNAVAPYQNAREIGAYEFESPIISAPTNIPTAGVPSPTRAATPTVAQQPTSSQPTTPPSTTDGNVLSISGNQFYLNGKPFKMWGVRVGSASQNKSYADQLISNLDDYKAHGINTITVFYQGTSGGSSDPFNDAGTGWNTDTPKNGTVNRDQMDRIIAEADKRGMVVIVGIFYGKVADADENLDGWSQAVQATRTVANHLESKGHKNIIINIANEQNGSASDSFPARPWGRVTNVSDLKVIADAMRAEYSSILIGAGGYSETNNKAIVIDNDFDALLFDLPGQGEFNANGTERVFNIYRNHALSNNKPVKPMVNVEIFGGETKQWLPQGVFSSTVRGYHYYEVDLAVRTSGLSVFLHNNPWFQGPSIGSPIHFEIGGAGSSTSPGMGFYFDYVQSKVGAYNPPGVTTVPTSTQAPATPTRAAATATPATGGNSGRYLESNGLLVVEAENYTTITRSNYAGYSPRDNHYWSLKTGQPNSTSGATSGDRYVLVEPDQRTESEIHNNECVSGFECPYSPKGTEGARMDYPISVSKTGTYYVWVRGLAKGGESNGVHVGVDGQLTNASNMTGFRNPGIGKWGWDKDRKDGYTDPARVEITAGNHTLNVWSRDDGFSLDRVLLIHENSTYVPTGVGPAESRREGGAVVTQAPTATRIPTTISSPTPTRVVTTPPSPTTVPSTGIIIDDMAMGTGLNQFNYIGSSWNYCKTAGCGTGHYMNNNHWNWKANEYVTLTFTGSRIQLYGAKDAHHGIAAISIDGSSEQLVDLYSPSRQADTLVWTSNSLTNANHTLRVRVAGTKNAASSNTVIALDRVIVSTASTPTNTPIPTATNTPVPPTSTPTSLPPSPTFAPSNVIDDMAMGTGMNQINYVGANWKDCRNRAATCGAGLYGNSNHWNWTPNEYAVFTFTGTQVQFFGVKDAHHGIAAVSIDGGTETFVDMYAPVRQGDALVWTSPSLPYGTHTMKVRVTGSKNSASTDETIGIDKIIVSTTVAQTTSVIDVDDKTKGTGMNQFNYVSTNLARPWKSCSTCADTWSFTAGDYATIRFEGTKTQVFAVKDAHHGQIALSVDGGVETIVDLYSSARQGNALVWMSPTLTQGPHTLRLRVVGTKNAASTGIVGTLDKVSITSVN